MDTEPNDKESPEWREWNAKKIFGSSFVETMKKAIERSGNGEQIMLFIADLCGISLHGGIPKNSLSGREYESNSLGKFAGTPKGIIKLQYQFIKEK